MLKKLIFFNLLLLVFCGLLLSGLGYSITRDIAKNKVLLADGESWFDDWYTVTQIDEQTFAIGEPRYWQRNYNYLLVGSNKAVLFDTGAGVRNIKPVAESLTDQPITVISSHPHYDHIGNNHRFSRIAWLDVESIRTEVKQGVYRSSFKRGFTIRNIPSFRITEWWSPGQLINIGERELKIYSVPGHEETSVAIHDIARNYVFTGDFIYPGWLVGFAPTSNISEYLSSTRWLVDTLSGKEVLYGAHSVPEHPSPTLPFDALIDLEQTLSSITTERPSPKHRFPLKIYQVNQDLDFYLPPL